jgi:hypothetical protein
MEVTTVRMILLLFIASLLFGCGTPMGYNDDNLGIGYAKAYQQCVDTRESADFSHCEREAAGKTVMKDDWSAFRLGGIGVLVNPRGFSRRDEYGYSSADTTYPSIQQRLYEQERFNRCLKSAGGNAAVC